MGKRSRSHQGMSAFPFLKRKVRKDSEMTVTFLFQIVRSWNLLENQTLEQVVLMETKNTPLTEHLRVIYSKVD